MPRCHFGFFTLSDVMTRLSNALKWSESDAGKAAVEETKRSQRAVKYRAQHRYVRERRQVDSAFHILCNLRGRTRAAVRSQTAKKYASTKALLGCTLAEFKAHIQAQFTAGMTWENYGRWHIDHIRPCSSFDLLDPDQQRACFHWSNLQPLWAAHNRAKGNRQRA